MNATAETPKSIVEYEGRAVALRERAKALVVDSQESHDRACLAMNTIKDFVKGFRAFFDPVVKDSHDVWKRNVARRDGITGPCETAITALNGRVVSYRQAQQRAQQELERKAREEANRQAEEIRLQKASEAEAAGMDAESVEAILDEPVYVAPEPVAPLMEKPADPMRDHWVAELDEDGHFGTKAFHQFATWAVKNKRFGLLRIDPTAVGALAREIKDTAAIPGLRIQNKPVVATGRR